MKREWLIKLRNKLGLTQEELSKTCDTTQMTISKIENGERRPKPELAKKLGKVLNFDWTKFYK